MLKIRSSQLSEISNRRHDELKYRIDRWLKSDLAEWSEEPIDYRLKLVDEVIQIASSAGLYSDLDYALFVRITAECRPDWQAFIHSDPVQAVLNCPRRPSKAKVREVYQLSRLD